MVSHVMGTGLLFDRSRNQFRLHTIGRVVPINTDSDFSATRDLDFRNVRHNLGHVSPSEIDAYLANVPEPQRSTLQSLRKLIHSVLRNAEECITYGVPTFKVDGDSIAGFAAYKKHCSYFPMSGRTLSTLSQDVANYETSKGALRFAVDRCLPVTLVKKLITARLNEIGARANRQES